MFLFGGLKAFAADALGEEEAAGGGGEEGDNPDENEFGDEEQIGLAQDDAKDDAAEGEVIGFGEGVHAAKGVGEAEKADGGGEKEKQPQDEENGGEKFEDDG